MPLFDYRCIKCGKAEELLIRSTDLQPQCCGALMERDFPKSHFALKGDGWAHDLYSKPSSSPQGPIVRNDAP